MKIYSTKRRTARTFDNYIGKDLWLLLPAQPGYPRGRWVHIIGRYPEYSFYMVNYVDNRPTSKQVLDRCVARTDALPLRAKFPRDIEVLTTEELYETLVF